MEKTAFLNREAVTASQEGTLAVELFLMSHYRFRRNILNGKVEFAQLPDAADAAEGHTAGTADSLYNAAGEIRSAQRSGKMIGCLEEIAVNNRWITVDQLEEAANALKQTQYGKYLMGVLNDLKDEV